MRLRLMSADIQNKNSSGCDVVLVLNVVCPLPPDTLRSSSVLSDLGEHFKQNCLDRFPKEPSGIVVMKAYDAGYTVEVIIHLDVEDHHERAESETSPSNQGQDRSDL